jgi:NAD(P)-dependent dehydrogenase (short-subunit alcohol dehydrogenase family)
MALEIDLKGLTAVVTGISSGIGLGVAEMLMKAGAAVAGCSRTLTPELEQLQVKAAEQRDRLYCHNADVTSPNQLKKFVQSTAERFGTIDLLVSNAGANVFQGAADCSLEIWQHNIDLNLKSHWMISNLCRPYLERSANATIIIMTSNHAYATIPGCFPYNVTKTALLGLVRSLAIEWGPNIRTIGLAPGFIDTPGNDAWFRSFPDPEAERRKTIDMHPVGKLGTPEEVGAFCAFLASPFASFASGCTYVLDGGRTALLQD